MSANMYLTRKVGALVGYLQCKPMSLILIAVCLYMSVDLHQGFTITMLWHQASGGEVMLLPAKEFG